MLNERGGIAIEVLVMLIVVVVTSAIVLVLVQTGTIAVKAESQDVSLLNTEFIPHGRAGSLVIKEFQFCSFIDEQYNCEFATNDFILGDEVHFLFTVESSVHDGNVMLVENYRVRGPHGNLLLDVDEKNNFHFDLISNDKKELITIADYFTVGGDLEAGEYTLELVLENPLLDKRATLSKTFTMEELEYESEEYYYEE